MARSRARATYESFTPAHSAWLAHARTLRMNLSHLPTALPAYESFTPAHSAWLAHARTLCMNLSHLPTALPASPRSSSQPMAIGRRTPFTNVVPAESSDEEGDEDVEQYSRSLTYQPFLKTRGAPH
eukprot:356755-Chlamydomonas_euryale.AAC.4